MFEAKSGLLSKEELEEQVRRDCENRFPSVLRTFSDHYGLRRGELHMMIAPSGGGKSSFSRSLIFELLKCARVFLYLSEEPRESYVKDVNLAYIEAVKDSQKKDHTVFLNRLKVMSELDMKKEDQHIFFEILKDEFLDHKSEVLIFDNITTSFLATLGITEEARTIMFFKKLANELDIPIVIFIHTQKGTSIAKGAFSAENIRGNATTALMGSYIYVLTLIKLEKKARFFVDVNKARYHMKSNGSIYELIFDESIKLFTRDLKSTRRELAEAIYEYNEEASGKSKKKAISWRG